MRKLISILCCMVICLLYVFAIPFRVEAASVSVYEDIVEVYTSEIPVGRIVQGDDARKLIRASLYEDMAIVMNQWMLAIRGTKSRSSALTELQRVQGSKDGLVLPAWGSVLNSQDDWSNDYPYIVFNVSGITYSFKWNVSDIIAGAQDGKRVVRICLYEAAMPYSYCIYSPDVGTIALSATDLQKKIDENDVFLEYIVHPFLGAFPVEGMLVSTGVNSDNNTYFFFNYIQAGFDEAQIKDITLFSGFWLSKTYGLWASRMEDKATKMIHTFGVTLSYQYVTFVAESSNKENFYRELTSLDDSLYPTEPFSTGLVYSQLKPYALLHTLVPVAYVSEWKAETGKNKHGIYSMYWNTADVVEDKPNMYKSTLSSYDIENNVVTLREPTKDTNFRLSFLTSLAGVPCQWSEGVAVYPDSDADIKTAEESAISVLSSKTDTVYVSLADGCYYKLDTETLNPGSDLFLPNVEKSAGLVFTRYTNLGKAETDFMFIKTTCAPIGTKWETASYGGVDTNQRHLVALPKTVNEGVILTETVKETSEVTGSFTYTRNVSFIDVGRSVTIDYSLADSMDMLLEGQGFRYSNDNTNQAKGVFYNQNGTLSSTSNDDIKNLMVYTSTGPCILLSSAYVLQSGVTNWLTTDTASSYMSNSISVTGYTAGSLYTRLITSGVNIGVSVIGDDDIGRFLEIEDELAGDVWSTIKHWIFTILAFLGLVIMVYSTALVVAYFLDIFNTFADISILGILTFGGCQAINSRSELEQLGVNVGESKKVYVTKSGIILRWAFGILVGILLFSTNHLFIWAIALFEKIASIFGLK